MQDRIDYKKIDFNSAREILGGKNVVFTGRGFLVRGELMRLARQTGANVDTVVTKKCDLLIVGEKPGRKLRKAKVLGCEIITTNDFKDILEGKISNVENDIDEDILNINTNENINEVIYILRKNILLLINNEAIKMKTIRNIKLNGGNIIENFEEEKVDLIVYQPSSKITNILDKAKKDNINTISLGVFNKMLMN